MDLEKDGVGLAECLTRLRDDLSKVAEQGKGSAIRFEIQDVKLEFSLVASNKAKGGAGIKWYLLSASAEAEVSDAVTQKITMNLGVVDAETGERKTVSGTEKR